MDTVRVTALILASAFSAAVWVLVIWGLARLIDTLGG